MSQAKVLRRLVGREERNSRKAKHMTDALHHQINAFEAEFDYPMDYARAVVAVDPALYQQFYQATQLGDYQGGLSPDVGFIVKLLGVMAGDCGTCVQLGVKMAIQAGITDDIIRATLEGRLDQLPEDLRVCASFARALLARGEDLPQRRDALVARHGDAGAIAIAFGVIASSMYPTLKYALGHGHQCSLIVVGGERVKVERSCVIRAHEA